MDLWKNLRNRYCKNCRLSKTARNPCLIGDGDMNKGVVIIGEAPGEREDDIRKPFAGRAGKMLDKIIAAIGWEREDFYITNACKCRPPDNETPSIQEIRACREYLIEEIEELNPRIVICLGAVAAKSVVNSNQMSVKTGRKTEIRFQEFPDLPVFVTYHTSYALRTPAAEQTIREDLERFLGINKPRKRKARYELILDPGLAADIASDFLKHGRGSLDFETSGLDTYDADFFIVSMALSRRPGRAYAFDKKLWPAVLEAINRPGFTARIQNAKYELHCMRAYTIRWRGGLEDNLIELHLLNENEPSKDLHTQKRKHTDLGEREEEIAPYKGQMPSLPIEVVASYNCEDVDATERLRKIYRPQIKKQKLEPLLDLELASTRMLVDVEQNGVNLDRELLDQNIELFGAALEAIESMFPGINLNSGDQLADYLYRDLGMRVLERTPKKDIGSVKAEVLDQLKGTVKGYNHRQKLDWIICYKKIRHFNSHFLSGLERHIKQDGLLHPRYNLIKHEDPEKGKEVGTVTGRLSCTDPNLQQIPRDTTELDDVFRKVAAEFPEVEALLPESGAPQIKEMFVSRWKGGCITQVDYSQIELRLMAEYSGDRNMLRDFDSGVDIHDAVTKRMYKVAKNLYVRRFGEDFAAARKFTKSVNFGIIYLISAWALGERLEIGTKAAENVIRAWFSIYPDVRKWIRHKQGMISRTKESKSLIGRIRRLPGAGFGDSTGREQLRQGVNSPIQGLAADLTKMAMIETNSVMEQEGAQSLLIGNVHDASLFDTYPGEEKYLAQSVRRIYVKPALLDNLFGVRFRVPIEVDILQNPSWSKGGGKKL